MAALRSRHGNGYLPNVWDRAASSCRCPLRSPCCGLLRVLACRIPMRNRLRGNPILPSLTKILGLLGPVANPRHPYSSFRRPHPQSLPHALLVKGVGNYAPHRRRRLPSLRTPPTLPVIPTPSSPLLCWISGASPRIGAKSPPLFVVRDGKVFLPFWNNLECPRIRANRRPSAVVDIEKVPPSRKERSSVSR